MRIFTLLLATIFSLHGSPSEPSDDSILVAELLDVLKTYDEEEIARYVHPGNAEFVDLRRYYGWYVYGTEPVRAITLGSASQRKRYVHVECKISDNVSPGRDWNNYLIEIRQLDNKSLLSKIGIPGKGVDIEDWEASPNEIAELIIASEESNPSAVTEIQILCQEDLSKTAEVKAYRCSLVETRLVLTLRISTYVDAVIYIIKCGDRFTGHLVRLMNYEMARLPNTEQGSTGQPATRSESDSEGVDGSQPEAEGRSR